MGADGSTAEYERICDELWGPRSLYLLSVVTPQKPITVRMKGEDGQTIPISHGHRAGAEGAASSGAAAAPGAGRVSGGEPVGARESGEPGIRSGAAQPMQAAHYDLDALLVADVADMATAKSTAVAEAKAHHRTAEDMLGRRRADLEAVAKDAAASREARARAKAIDDQIKRMGFELQYADNDLAQHGEAPEDATLHEAIIRNAEADDRRLVELRAAASDADNAWSATSAEIIGQIREHELRLNEAEHKMLDFIDQRARLQRSLDAIERQPDTCSHCGQGLPAAALAKVASQRASLQSEMTGLRTGEELAIAMRKAEKVDHRRSERHHPGAPDGAGRVDEPGGIGQATAELALAKARTDLQRAQEWATKRQALEDERERLTERIAAAEQDLLKTEAGVNMATEVRRNERSGSTSSTPCRSWPTPAPR